MKNLLKVSALVSLAAFSAGSFADTSTATAAWQGMLVSVQKGETIAITGAAGGPVQTETLLFSADGNISAPNIVLEAHAVAADVVGDLHPNVVSWTVTNVNFFAGGQQVSGIDFDVFDGITKIAESTAGVVNDLGVLSPGLVTVPNILALNVKSTNQSIADPTYIIDQYTGTASLTVTIVVSDV